MDENIRLAARATTDYLTQRSVALILRTADGGVAIGSSTCVQVGDHFLLATAAHNFEGLGINDSIELIPASELTRKKLPFLAKSEGPSGKQVGEDVAWIELSAQTVKENNLKFVTLSEITPYQEYTRSYAFYIQGYPAASVEGDLATGRQLSLASTAALTMMANAKDVPRKLTTGELAFEYPPRDEQELPMMAPHPAGLSGGGVWWHPRHDESPIWIPERVQLVGINRVWHQRSSILYAARMEAWLRLVAGAFPDTAEVIGDYLDGQVDTE